ncbi:hypothetical protein Tco_1523178 [Tanacetum coccineum]
MAQLKYCDKHNQVGFLRKPDESAGFAEIVDFLRGSNLRYALTTNPTIYDSLVKQFWQTATTNTHANGTLEIKATIDNIRYTITEASIRDSLQLDDATGITMLPNDELFEGMGQIGSGGCGSVLVAILLNALTVYPLPGGKWFSNKPKLTMGNALVMLLKKSEEVVEGFLNRRNLVLIDSEDEEPEAQGRKSQDDPQDSSIQGLVTPPLFFLFHTRTGKEIKSKGKETKGKKVVSSLDFQEDDTAEKINTAGEINAAGEEVNTASKVNTGSIELNTVIEQDSTAEEASLAEAIRLDSLQKEEEAKQIHLDALLAQRIAEEEELTEQQKKRKAQDSKKRLKGRKIDDDAKHDESTKKSSKEERRMARKGKTCVIEEFVNDALDCALNLDGMEDETGEEFDKIREGQSKTLKQCLEIEYVAICHVLGITIGNDYYEALQVMDTGCRLFLVAGPLFLQFLGASFTQGTVSSIPIVGSISPEGFLPPILLLVVIIVAVILVVVVAIVGVVIVVAIIGVVVVVSGVSFIIKLSFVIISSLLRIVFCYLIH